MSRKPDGEEVKVKKSYREEPRYIEALEEVYGSFSEGLKKLVRKDKKLKDFLKKNAK